MGTAAVSNAGKHGDDRVGLAHAWEGIDERTRDEWLVRAPLPRTSPGPESNFSLERLGHSQAARLELDPACAIL
jgi:hypothetical protein